MAVAIAGRGDYGVRYMNGITTESQIRIKQPAYNSSGMNVSIAWLVEPADENTIGSTIDLDLEVYAGVEKVGSSTCDVSSSEMAYITPSSNEDDYNFVIKRISDTGDVIRFAYAFSIDNARYQYSDELEGVHFIKNSFNGAYLTYSDTGEITQELYTGDKSQQWFIYDNKIFPVLDSNKGFATGDVISLSYKKVIVRSFGRSQLTFMPNTYESNLDGTYIIHNTGNNALVPFNNASSVGTLLSWYPMSTSNSSQKWYLDSVSYQKGDINLDGVLSNNDSIMLSDYLAGNLTFTNIQEYMADINGDDVIDSNDSELISQIITN